MQCDTRRLVSDTDWTSYATCAWNKMYGGSSGGGSSTTGATGTGSGSSGTGTGAGTGGIEATSQQPQQQAGRRRRGLLSGSGSPGSSTVVRQDPGDEYAGNCGAGDYPGDSDQGGQELGDGGEGWGLGDGRAVGVGGQGPVRRRLTGGGGGKNTQYAPETRVYFDEALVMVYQRTGTSGLTQRAAGGCCNAG